MTWPTHTLFGISALWLLAPLPPALLGYVNGQTSPSFAVVSTITRALSDALGKMLNPHDVISMDGTYPTPSVCVLADCRGCLPDEAYDDNDCLKPEYKNIKPGHWKSFPKRLASNTQVLT